MFECIIVSSLFVQRFYKFRYKGPSFPRIDNLFFPLSRECRSRMNVFAKLDSEGVLSVWQKYTTLLNTQQYITMTFLSPSLFLILDNSWTTVISSKPHSYCHL